MSAEKCERCGEVIEVVASVRYGGRYRASCGCRHVTGVLVESFHTLRHRAIGMHKRGIPRWSERGELMPLPEPTPEPYDPIADAKARLPGWVEMAPANAYLVTLTPPCGLISAYNFWGTDDCDRVEHWAADALEKHAERCPDPTCPGHGKEQGDSDNYNPIADARARLPGWVGGKNGDCFYLRPPCDFGSTYFFRKHRGTEAVRRLASFALAEHARDCPDPTCPGHGKRDTMPAVAEPAYVDQTGIAAGGAADVVSIALGWLPFWKRSENETRTIEPPCGKTCFDVLAITPDRLRDECMEAHVYHSASCDDVLCSGHIFDHGYVPPKDVGYARNVHGLTLNQSNDLVIGAGDVLIGEATKLPTPEQKRYVGGVEQSPEPCRQCGGAWTLKRDPCPTCHRVSDVIPKTDPDELSAHQEYGKRFFVSEPAHLDTRIAAAHAELDRKLGDTDTGYRVDYELDPEGW